MDASSKHIIRNNFDASRLLEVFKVSEEFVETNMSGYRINATFTFAICKRNTEYVVKIFRHNQNICVARIKPKTFIDFYNFMSAFGFNLYTNAEYNRTYFCINNHQVIFNHKRYRLNHNIEEMEIDFSLPIRKKLYTYFVNSIENNGRELNYIRETIINDLYKDNVLRNSDLFDEKISLINDLILGIQSQYNII